jgi:prepilin-type N-terminal cleavage/methylation domain-containing protein/prepilin-type processing-associated H-X9-DG protein
MHRRRTDRKTVSEPLRTARRGKRGFTLIELLVVIAIIAILAAILFPVFAAARDKARSVHCLSNQKQLVQAFMSYTDDWEGALPRTWTSTGGPAKPAGSKETSFLGLPWGQRDWATDTFKYVGSAGIYRCPSKELYRGYGFNAWLAGGDDPVLISDIDFPSKTCLFAEIIGVHQSTSENDFVDRSTPNHWPTDDRFWFDARHHGGANIGFGDGHAKWVKSSVYTEWPKKAPNGVPEGTYWSPTASAP